MIGHDYIGGYLYVFRIFQILKPFINQIIAVGDAKQWKPFVTGEGYKVKTNFIAM